MDIIIILPAIHLSHLPTILPVSSGFTFLLNVDGSFGHFHPIRALSLDSLSPFPYDSMFLSFFFFSLLCSGFSVSVQEAFLHQARVHPISSGLAVALMVFRSSG